MGLRRALSQAMARGDHKRGSDHERVGASSEVEMTATRPRPPRSTTGSGSAETANGVVGGLGTVRERVKTSEEHMHRGHCVVGGRHHRVEPAKFGVPLVRQVLECESEPPSHTVVASVGVDAGVRRHDPRGIGKRGEAASCRIDPEPGRETAERSPAERVACVGSRCDGPPARGRRASCAR